MVERVHAFAADGPGGGAAGDAPAAGEIAAAAGEIAAADGPDGAGAASSIDGATHACGATNATCSAGSASTAGGKTDGSFPGAKQAAAGDEHGEVGWVRGHRKSASTGGRAKARDSADGGRAKARRGLVRRSCAGYNRPGGRATCATVARSDLIGATAA